ncbi:NYN domain-containing protein [candidate division WOR-3 bacterium]|nr:NYN domain-containing protein [candidate division WOR-3 bacterium]
MKTKKIRRRRKTANNSTFIDSQNLNLAIREQGWILDFRKFRKYLRDKYHVTKAFLFIGYVAENQAMYTQLQESGYILVFKPTLTLPSGVPKGNVDAELVLHAMIEYRNYAKALIVTGDGDFHCLVDYLSKNGKLLKLMIPNRKKFSSLYRKMMDNIVFMNDLRRKLAYVPKKKRKKGGIT